MKAKVDWKSIDYKQSSKAIAAQTGATEKAVYKARKRHAPRTMHKYNHHSIQFNEKWSGVDWTKRDVDISRESGYSLQSVRKARQRFLNK